MNKPSWLLLAVLVLSLSVLACRVSLPGNSLDTVRGRGPVAEEARRVEGFDRLEFSGLGNLIIDRGEKESLIIEAEDNLLEYIETELREGTLHIGVEEGINLLPTEPISFYLDVVALEEISVSGAGDIEAPELEASQFAIRISGAGDVDVSTLTADELEVNISGVGDLTIDGGAVDRQSVNISGAGDYRARGLESAETEIQLSGLGVAIVWAQESLEVNISGTGSVRYRGNPDVEQNISGLGQVEPLDE